MKRGVYRLACHIRPLLGENNRAARNIPVATTTILGPVGRSAWNDRYRPATLDMRPTRTLKTIIAGNLRAKSAAVAAGVGRPRVLLDSVAFVETESEGRP